MSTDQVDRPPRAGIERLDLGDALAMEVDGATVRAHVHDDHDVQGIPHGGYLAAIAARAILLASGQPDLFTVTVHFLRKAAVGPIDLEVRHIGGSRRFATWHATATQDGEVVLTAMASVGDRTDVDGPAWTDVEAWRPDETSLTPPAGHPDLPFDPPPVAKQVGLRMDAATAAFAMGQRTDRAELRAVMETGVTDQLAALVACDITPPAAWNVLGVTGWVPTVELTAHVRARPEPGPLSVEAATHHVAGGFLEEDAVVRDVTGRLVVQSRQLARWTQA